MSEPSGQQAEARECDDSPKLTAEEWAYIAAVTDADQATEGGDD